MLGRVPRGAGPCCVKTAALDAEIAVSGLQQGPAAYLRALVPRQLRSAWRKAYGYGKRFACGNIGQSPSTAESLAI
jgi:hypothetical protein